MPVTNEVWQSALEAWAEGNKPGDLARLLRDEEVIPQVVRDLLADVLEGKKRREGRPSKHAGQAAQDDLVWLRVDCEALAEYYADRNRDHGDGPKDVAKRHLAKKYNVSESTIQKRLKK